MPALKFQDNRDRLTFLFAEYKLLISGLFVGLVGLLVYYRPEFPTLPTWVPAFLFGWLILAIPCYLVGLKIARWLRNRNWVEVHHVNAAEDTVQKHYVPPELWREKDIDGPDPYAINGGSAWAVREYEYLADVDELRVRGVWLEGCQDTELMTAKKQMEDIHDWLVERAEELAAIRGRWSRGAVELQSKLVNAESEALERGQMIEKTAAANTFGNLIEAGEEFEDAPSIHDLKESSVLDAIEKDDPDGISHANSQSPEEVTQDG